MATIPYVFASATSPLPLSQLDDNFTSLNAAKAELTASTTPLMDGAAAIGSATTAAKADHVHPTDTSLTVFTPSGTGAVPTTVQAKLRESVSVKDFGAVGDGVMSDDAAIQNALNNSPAGACIYFPAGTYLRTNGIGSPITIPAGKSVFSNGDAVIRSANYPVFAVNDGCTVDGLNFSNGVGVSIGLQILGNDITIKNNTFTGGSQIVYVYAANRLLVESNRFVSCGYQVLQVASYSSNDCRVVNNSSVNCTLDFVELNGAVACKNWLVANNTCVNLGGANPTAVATEARFFGATCCDGIVIMGNTVDSCAGDSMIHLEGLAKNIVISNNTFFDPHGAFGSLLFIAAGLSSNKILFINNLVRLRSTYATLTGGGSVLIYDTAGSAGNLVIDGNTFENLSAVAMTAIFVGYTAEEFNIIGNLFKGISTIANIGLAGAANISSKFTENIISAATNGCVIAAGATQYNVIINNNQYANCTNVFTGAAPLELIGNKLRGTSTIDEAAVIGKSIARETCKLNSGGTTTRAIAATYTTGSPIIFSAESYTSYMIAVRAGDSSYYSNNASWGLYVVTWQSPVGMIIATVASGSTGTGAGFTLAVSGTNMTFTAASGRVLGTQILGKETYSHTSIA